MYAAYTMADIAHEAIGNFLLAGKSIEYAVTEACRALNGELEEYDSCPCDCCGRQCSKTALDPVVWTFGDGSEIRMEHTITTNTNQAKPPPAPEKEPTDYRLRRVASATAALLNGTTRVGDLKATVNNSDINNLERAVYLLCPDYSISEVASNGWCSQCDSFSCDHAEASS